MICDICPMRGNEESSPSYTEWLLDSGRDWASTVPGFIVFDKDGEPMEYSRWVWTIEFDPEYKVIGHDHVGDGRISTVWLGINHNFSVMGTPPILFESMVFDIEGWRDYQDRYFTEGEAIAAHKSLVAKVTASLK